jgi:hypothetical protein
VPTITRKIVHDLPCYKINFSKRKISEKIEAAGWELVLTENIEGWRCFGSGSS